VCAANCGDESFKTRVLFKTAEGEGKYLTGEGDCLFITEEFKVRALAPAVSDAEKENLIKATECADSGEEFKLPVEEKAEEPPKAKEPISEAIAEAAAEAQSVEEQTEEKEEKKETAEEAPVKKWSKVPKEERPEAYILNALKTFVEKKEASVSLLQRRPLNMNYAMAERTLNWMAEKGYVEKTYPLGYWKLLIDEEDFKTLYE